MLFLNSLRPNQNFENAVIMALHQENVTGQDMRDWNHQSLMALGIDDFEMRVHIMSKLQHLIPRDDFRGELQSIALVNDMSMDHVLDDMVTPEGGDNGTL